MFLLALCLIGSDLDASIDAYLKAETEQKRFTGVVLIAKDGQPLVRRAYGYADWTTKTPNTPETAFMLYSNTKQFTAAAILMVRDRGKFALTDPISRHLPACPPEWEPVTLHHLLSHTSGIELDNLWSWIYNHYPAYREGPELGPYERKELISKPGEKFQYSNVGYMLLARVIAKTSGKDFQRFLEEDIFAPLGMTHTGCDRDKLTLGRAHGHDLSGVPVISEQPTHGIVGAGDVYSTLDDLLKWDEALYGDKVLSPASREAMFNTQFKTARGGVGYGWFVRRGQDGSISHFQHGGSGAGFTSVLNYDTELKIGEGCRERLDAWPAR
jgi:D-alanyl-D-alanine carboxypeptidase